MNRLLSVFAVIISFASLSQEFDWAIGIGSSGTDIGKSITVDDNGNSYVTGFFLGTADFDPSANTVNLTSPTPDMPSAFIAKYDIDGDLVWAKAVTGSKWVYGEKIAIDGSGNIYITGYFGGVADFDPSAGSASITVAGGASSNRSDAYFAKYDNSGNYLWAKRIGGTEDDRGKDIHVDMNGNVFLTGTFRFTANFDPGASNTSVMASSNSTDIYLAKFNDLGNFQWVNTFGGTSSAESSWAISSDNSGNSYLSAVYFGSVDFDPSPGNAILGSTNGDEMVLAKYDVNGNYLWAKKIGGGLGEKGKALKIDASGNAYVAGIFGGTVDFDPTSGVNQLSSVGSNDVFVAKYDNSGNLTWARSFGGDSSDDALGIDIDSDGDVYVVGSFQNDVIFDQVSGYELSSAGTNDLYILKLATSGDFDWVQRIGGSSLDEAHDVAVDDNKNIHVIGRFNTTVDFDPSGNENEITTNGMDDIFILRLTAAPCATYFTTQVAVACGDFTWIDGNTYDNSTTATYTTPSVSGCDSIVTLDLTINSPVNVTDEQQSCGPFTWIDGNTYNSSNNSATWVETAANGCDSIITLDLTVFETFPVGATVELEDELVCSGESTTVSISSTGNGVNYYLRDDLNNSIVDGPILGDGGSIELTTGELTSPKTFNVYAETASEAYGIDLPQSSNDYINFLNVFESYGTSITIEAWVYSDGTEMPYAGQSRSGIDNNTTSNVWAWTAGTFYVNHSGAWMPLTMPSLSQGWTHIATVADENGMYVYYNGSLVNSSTNGVFAGIREPSGSIISLGRDPRYPEIDPGQNSDNMFADFRVWNVARSESEIFANMNECLSGSETGLVQYTKFTEGSGTTASSLVGEDGIISNGTWVSRDVGCGYFECNEEFASTFDVTIGEATFNTVEISACNEYTWAQNNETYVESGTYIDVIPNAIGCDSTVTLDLTISFTEDQTDVISECDSYTWIDGNTYTSSNNTATFTETNAAGCEYEVTLDLTINASTTGTDVISACNSYSWIDGNTYTTDNNSATYTLTNAAGCDSIVTLDLTINDGEINTDVTVNGSTLSTDGSADAYQWVDCENNNAVIDGETGATFTATSPGEYAVIVTNGDCTETSECVVVETVGVKEEAFADKFLVYPNPTTSIIYIDGLSGNHTLNLKSMEGKTIQTLTELEYVDLSSLPKGTYLIQIIDQQMSTVKRVIKM